MIADRRHRSTPLTRALLPVLTAVFIGVLLSSLLAYFHTRNTVTELALDRTEQALLFLDREVDALMRRTSFHLRQWSSEEVFALAIEDSYLGLAARKAAQERMQVRTRDSLIGRLALARPDGNIIVSSNTDLARKVTVGDRDYFQRAMNGELAFQTIAKGRYLGFPVLIGAAPVRNVLGKTVGVLIAILDIPELAGMSMQAATRGGRGEVHIVDHQGLVLASTAEGDLGTTWPAETMALVAESAEADTFRILRENRSARILVARHNARSGWDLVIEADEEEVLRPATRLGWITGTVSLATLLLVIIALAGLRRALAVLRQSEEKFSKLFLLSPDAIVLLKLPEGTVAEANESFCRLLDRTQAAVLGKTLPQLGVRSPEREQAVGIEDLTTHSRVENMDVEAASSEGVVLPCMLTAQEVRLDARPHMIVILRDVSELKHMQEIMVQTEKMMSLGGLAAGIAHEINNPLAGILGFSQNAQRRLFGGGKKSLAAAEACALDPKKIKEYLEMMDLPMMLDAIHQSGVRAARIVKNMLNFSRKGDKTLTPMDVGDLVDSAVDLASSDYDLHKRYDFKQIEIVRDYAPDPPAVFCDANEIQQVLLNLLKNGAEAMSEKDYGTESPRFTLRTRLGEGEVIVEIEDNGPGMDEATRKRIFEPFYTTKGVGRGTGLGLAVSYFIITDQHGGRMEAHSTPGEGTRFLLALPLSFPSARDDADEPR